MQKQGTVKRKNKAALGQVSVSLSYFADTETPTTWEKSQTSWNQVDDVDFHFTTN